MNDEDHTPASDEDGRQGKSSVAHFSLPKDHDAGRPLGVHPAELVNLTFRRGQSDAKAWTPAEMLENSIKDAAPHYRKCVVIFLDQGERGDEYSIFIQMAGMYRSELISLLSVTESFLCVQTLKENHPEQM